MCAQYDASQGVDVDSLRQALLERIRNKKKYDNVEADVFASSISKEEHQIVLDRLASMQQDMERLERDRQRLLNCLEEQEYKLQGSVPFEDFRDAVSMKTALLEQMESLNELLQEECNFQGAFRIEDEGENGIVPASSKPKLEASKRMGSRERMPEYGKPLSPGRRGSYPGCMKEAKVELPSMVSPRLRVVAKEPPARSASPTVMIGKCGSKESCRGRLEHGRMQTSPLRRPVLAGRISQKPYGSFEAPVAGRSIHLAYETLARSQKRYSSCEAPVAGRWPPIQAPVNLTRTPGSLPLSLTHLYKTLEATSATKPGSIASKENPMMLAPNADLGAEKWAGA